MWNQRPQISLNQPSWNVNQIQCQCADPVAASTEIQLKTAYAQFALRCVITFDESLWNFNLSIFISTQDALRKKQTPPVSSTPVLASSPVNSSTQTINPSTAVTVPLLSNQSTPTHDHNTAQPTVLLHNQSSADKEVRLAKLLIPNIFSQWPLTIISSRYDTSLFRASLNKFLLNPLCAPWRRDRVKTKS